MSVSYIPEQEDYKELTPFKRFVLQSFPWINENFDALTNYELMGKIIEYLNEVITNQNTTNDNVTTLYNAMLQFQDYINNYFDNLDVQEEINNKLDSMVEDGTMENLIYNVVYDECVVMIGDSYGVGNTYGGTITGWCDRLKELMKIPTSNYYKFVEGGCGFVTEGISGHTFLELLQANINTITDKTKVKKVIVCGGYNDKFSNSTDITTNVSAFISYCKTQFENATIYVGMIGNTKENNSTGATHRTNISNAVLRGYQNCVTFGGVYLNGIENIMHDYGNFLSDDNIHPTEMGYRYLSSYLYNAIKTGYADYQSEQYNSTINFTNSDTTQTNFNIKSKLSNNVVSLFASACKVKFSEAQSVGQSITLGDIDVHFFRPTNREVTIPVKYYMQTSDGKFYGGFGHLSFSANGKIGFIPGILLNNGTAYLTVSNVTQINFSAFNYTIPTCNG